MTASIEAMAREAGLIDPTLGPWMTDYGNAEKELARFAALVRARTVEDAALVADRHSAFGMSAAQCAEAIRALPPLE